MSPDFQSVGSKRTTVNTPKGKRRRPSIELTNEVVILKDENVRVCFSMAKGSGIGRSGSPSNKATNKRRLFNSAGQSAKYKSTSRLHCFARNVQIAIIRLQSSILLFAIPMCSIVSLDVGLLKCK